MLRGGTALVHESVVRFRGGGPDWMDEFESPSHVQDEVLGVNVTLSRKVGVRVGADTLHVFHRHCQVDEKRVSRSLDDSVSIIVQQAHVTASQTQDDRALSTRW